MESAKVYPLNRNRFDGTTGVNAPASPPKSRLLEIGSHSIAGILELSWSAFVIKRVFGVDLTSPCEGRKIAPVLETFAIVHGRPRHSLVSVGPELSCRSLRRVLFAKLTHEVKI